MVVPYPKTAVQAGNGQAVAAESGITESHEGNLLVYVSAPHISAYHVCVLDGDIVSKEETHASLGDEGKPAEGYRHGEIC